VPATAELVRRLEARPDLTDLNAALAEEISKLLGEPPTLDVHADPSVLLVVGVNGTGKTTTVGKLANLLKGQGRKPLICAADTFRAAAVEQLEIWAARAGVEMVRAREGADPAAVVFDAISSGKAKGRDPILVDTAGCRARNAPHDGPVDESFEPKVPEDQVLHDLAGVVVVFPAEVDPKALDSGDGNVAGNVDRLTVNRHK